jgi:large subunit ribosomal protein L9
MAMMELLLKEDVESLGLRGELVKVRPGYGRNYLLPRGLAIQATPGNVRQIEMQRRALLKKEATEKAAAEAQAELLSRETLTFARLAGEQGTLFGSVTSIDIANALKERGFELDRRRIVLKDPIKELGESEVSIKLHREVTAPIKVVVTRETESAEAAKEENA